MRCRRCGERAAINMPEHKLALCAPHYLEWFLERTQNTLRKYRMLEPGDRILVAVSGGKDSLALWDVLLRLGLSADGLYIDLGIPDYSARSRQKVLAFAAEHPTARLHIVDVQAQYGLSVPELAVRKRGDNRTCSVCGIVKRHEMNRIALEQGYTVLATGHNLDDEAAVLFGNVLHWQIGYLARQYPVLPGDEAEGFARKIKPFCRFYEREVAAYTLLRGLDYIYEECPFAVGATSLEHKALLNQLEHRAPGTKLQFYVNFLRARQQEELQFKVEPTQVILEPCRVCGQPTTAGGLCAFCRLWQRETPSEHPVE